MNFYISSFFAQINPEPPIAPEIPPLEQPPGQPPKIPPKQDTAYTPQPITEP